MHKYALAQDVKTNFSFVMVSLLAVSLMATTLTAYFAYDLASKGSYRAASETFALYIANRLSIGV